MMKSTISTSSAEMVTLSALVRAPTLACFQSMFSYSRELYAVTDGQLSSFSFVNLSSTVSIHREYPSITSSRDFRLNLPKSTFPRPRCHHSPLVPFDVLVIPCVICPEIVCKKYLADTHCACRRIRRLQYR